MVWYKMKYLPTKRHKKPRTMSKCRKETVEIRELNKKDFPVAFIVKDYKSMKDRKVILNSKGMDISESFRKRSEQMENTCTLLFVLPMGRRSVQSLRILSGYIGDCNKMSHILHLQENHTMTNL